MAKAKSPQVSNADLRRQLDADVERFLKAGKKIQQIPTGVSSQDYSKGRKHIVLGKSKQQGELGGGPPPAEEEAGAKEAAGAKEEVGAKEAAGAKEAESKK